MEAQLAAAGLSATRVPAVHEPKRGVLGCAKSHVNALTAFLGTGAPFAVVLEDDFTLRDAGAAKDQLLRLVQSGVEWDLVMLAGNILRSVGGPVPFLRRVLDGQAASGYILRRDFARVIIDALEQSIRLLEEDFRVLGRKRHEHCPDIYWKSLQPKHRWFVYEPRIGFQMESFSDNTGSVANYGL